MTGCGNADAGDDGVGLIVAERLRAHLPAEVQVTTDPTGGSRLLDAGDDLDCLFVVDAASAGDGFPAGEWRAFSYPRDRHHLRRTARPGTHGCGVVEALELALALGRLPREVRVVAVAGEQFALGAGLSPAVEHSIPTIVRSLVSEVRDRVRRGPGTRSLEGEAGVRPMYPSST